MGSYINIGLISTENKEIFIDRCIELIGRLDKFNVFSIKYPEDEKYSTWIKKDMSNYTLESALQYCHQYDMAEMLCGFELENCYLENVLVRIKHIQKEGLCILFEIPEENDIFNNIDIAEKAIDLFLREKAEMGFKYAFCDSEANSPIKLDEVNVEEEYAIFISYEPKMEVVYASWKIDGLSDR